MYRLIITRKDRKTKELETKQFFCETYNDVTAIKKFVESNDSYDISFGIKLITNNLPIIKMELEDWVNPVSA